MYTKNQFKDEVLNEIEKIYIPENDKIYKDLASICVDTSMELIKENLKDLGIKHDNFVKESYFIKNNKVVETIKILETKNFVYKGKLKSPKGEYAPVEDIHLLINHIIVTWMQYKILNEESTI